MAAITKQRLLAAEEKAKETVLEVFAGPNGPVAETICRTVIFNINKNLNMKEDVNERTED